MHVLIIGGTRFVGRHIGEELLEQGHTITLLNRGVTPDTFPTEVERLRADRNEPEQVRAALEGREFDAIVDCIAYQEAEVELVIELFSGRIGRYVYISSSSVYRPSDLLPIEETHPLNDGTGWDYARGKIEVERLLERTATDAFPWVSLRPAYIFGPYNSAANAEFSLFQRIEQGRPVLVPGDGYFFFHQSHGRDLAHATIAAIERSEAIGNAYNINGRYAQSGNELVQAAAAAVGREAEIVYLPGATRRSEVGRYFYWQTRPAQVYSTEAARHDLAWEPRFDIHEGMRDAYRWYLESGYAEAHPYDFSAHDELLERMADGG
ncbi:MAG: NAD-dependent epimerase/dehydratase family protein [Chloroflexi bacterium]|nr:NAD-dependent epimerase/dehydratase family protein [Chloroflexota bacterium]